MTPAEAVAAIERLVEAGAKASPGEWQWIGATLETDQATVVGLETKGVSWMEYQVIAMDNRDADQAFIALAANCRPALSALAGMCVLPAEVVRGLIDAGLDSSVHDAGAESDCHACAALAAAEAELRRVDVRDV